MPREPRGNRLADESDLSAHVPCEPVGLREALKEHCLINAEATLAVRMDVNFAMTVSDGPARLLPGKRPETPPKHLALLQIRVVELLRSWHQAPVVWMDRKTPGVEAPAIEHRVGQASNGIKYCG